MRQVFTLLAALCMPMLAQAQQALLVDDEHLMMQRPGRPPAPLYEVKGAASLLLDGSQYAFEIPAAIADKPVNAVQVVVGKGHYSATWNPTERKLVLSAETLRPNGNSPAFAGFPVGQRVIIAIGNLEGPKFSVVWVGMADVK